MLNRQKLSQNMKSLQYEIDEKGMCYGLASMAVPAILSGNTKIYNERLTTFDILNYAFSTELENVKNKIQIDKENNIPPAMTRRENFVFTMPAFFENVIISQSPENYHHLFNRLDLQLIPDFLKTRNTQFKNIFILTQKSPIELFQFDEIGNSRKILNENELEKIMDLKKIIGLSSTDEIVSVLTYGQLVQLEDAILSKGGAFLKLIPMKQHAQRTFPFTLPDALMVEEKKEENGKTYQFEKTNVEASAIFSGVYPEQELHDYFRFLRETLIEQKPIYDEPISFILTNGKHAIAMGYNPKEKVWKFSNSSLIEDIKNDKDIADKVRCALLKSSGQKPGKRVAIFATQMFSKKTQSEHSKVYLEDLQNKKEWKKLHAVTKEKAQLINSIGMSWLYIATKYGDEETLKLLLDAGGAEPYIDTSLYGASQIGYAQMVAILLGRGANPGAAFREERNATSLHYAAQRDFVWIASALLEKGANPNAPLDNGITPLHFAASSKIVTVLLNYGANLNARTINHSLTPFHFAVRDNNQEVVKRFLEEKNLQIDAKLIGMTSELMDSAKERQKLHFMDKLIREKNNDVLVDKLMDFTALHIAAFFGYTDITELLLNHGANYQMKSNGLLARDLALAMGHEVIVDKIDEADLKNRLKETEKKNSLFFNFPERTIALKNILDEKIDQSQRRAFFAMDNFASRLILWMHQQRNQLSKQNKRQVLDDLENAIHRAYKCPTQEMMISIEKEAKKITALFQRRRIIGCFSFFRHPAYSGINDILQNQKKEMMGMRFN